MSRRTIAPNAETRQLEVARISRGLKVTSLRLRIPIIALSQFSRGASFAASQGDRPELHHLRDSGAVEQDADAVLTLWRTAAQRDADMQDRPRQVCLTLLKNRHGPVGDVYAVNAAKGPLIFDTSRQRFREYLATDCGIDGSTALPRPRAVGCAR